MTTAGPLAPSSVQLSHEILRQKSKSFHMASRLLPRHIRDRAAIVYAWCRRADDAVDEGARDERAAIEGLHRELDDLEEGRPSKDPLAVAFAGVVHRCRIPIHYPREMLRGMETDLGEVRHQTMDELLEYSYRVAGTVGLMMCHVMGVEDDRAVTHAAHLGVAMQLTNICRDVEEDWQRGRLYLPEHLLASRGASGLGNALGGEFPAAAQPAVADAVRDLLQLAHRYYESGYAGLGYLPWRCSLAIDSARRIYSEIGAVLAQRQWDVTRGRAVVSTSRKLELVGRSVFERVGTLRLRTEADRSYNSPTRALVFSEMPRL